MNFIKFSNTVIAPLCTQLSSNFTSKASNRKIRKWKTLKNLYITLHDVDEHARRLTIKSIRSIVAEIVRNQVRTVAESSYEGEISWNTKSQDTNDMFALYQSETVDPERPTVVYNLVLVTKFLLDRLKPVQDCSQNHDFWFLSALQDCVNSSREKLRSNSVEKFIVN